MTFHVGMKVVCVDDSVGHGTDFGFRVKRNSIYTIESFRRASNRVDGQFDGCTLREEPIANVIFGWKPAWKLIRFRPVEPKCAQLFRDIAAGVSNGSPIIPDDQPIRVPAPVEGWTVESLTADILRRAGE